MTHETENLLADCFWAAIFGACVASAILLVQSVL